VLLPRSSGAAVQSDGALLRTRLVLLAAVLSRINVPPAFTVTPVVEDKRAVAPPSTRVPALIEMVLVDESASQEQGALLVSVVTAGRHRRAGEGQRDAATDAAPQGGDVATRTSGALDG